MNVVRNNDPKYKKELVKWQYKGAVKIENWDFPSADGVNGLFNEIRFVLVLL